MKICSKCKLSKDISDFFKDTRKIDGLYSNCKKCQHIYQLQWQRQNREKISSYRDKSKQYNKKYHKKWRIDNIDKLNIYHKKWRDLNKIKLNAYRRKHREKPKNRIDSNMSWMIWYSLRGKKLGRKWEKLVSYTLYDLMLHLEKQFDNKMNWGNYGSYWEIDHIKPRSLFRYITENDMEFQKCWSLENLQPLEHMENLKKSNKFNQ